MRRINKKELENINNTMSEIDYEKEFERLKD